MKLHPDVHEFVALLNANCADYIVVGGHAVAYHGHPRFTGDLDLFFRPTLENAARVLASLRAFGVEDPAMTEDRLVDPRTLVQVGLPPNRIDLLSAVDGVTFDECWEDRTLDLLDGLPVAFMGRETLVRNKLAAGRLKDLSDVAELGREDDD